MDYVMNKASPVSIRRSRRSGFRQDQLEGGCEELECTQAAGSPPRPHGHNRSDNLQR